MPAIKNAGNDSASQVQCLTSNNYKIFCEYIGETDVLVWRV